MTLQKTESFVPLTTGTASPKNSGFQVTVIPQAQTTKTFQDLNKAALPNVETTTSHFKKTCEPQLSLQRDGDRITHIRIQCSCGQVMELACAYEDRLK